jgi:hypothetical protein
MKWRAGRMSRGGDGGERGEPEARRPPPHPIQPPHHDPTKTERERRQSRDLTHLSRFAQVPAPHVPVFARPREEEAAVVAGFWFDLNRFVCGNAMFDEWINQLINQSISAHIALVTPHPRQTASHQLINPPSLSPLPHFTPQSSHLIFSPVMPLPSCAATISATASFPPRDLRSYKPRDPAKEPAA